MYVSIKPSNFRRLLYNSQDNSSISRAHGPAVFYPLVRSKSKVRLLGTVLGIPRFGQTDSVRRHFLDQLLSKNKKKKILETPTVYIG
jgi:hypothetical protein